MKKSVYLLSIILVASMLSGCILSKTPSTNNVTMKVGEQKTFSVDAFPFNGTYAWNLDEVPLSNMGNSIVYTAKVGKHSLTVRATHALFIDKQTWNITSDPTIDLLNSMVYIPGGTFMMGSTYNWNGWAQYTTPVHQVTLSDFYMGAYEVTQAQYLAVMGNNPSQINYEGTDYNPVEQVSWYDAREFCQKLSVMTGRVFDLPSEAQWEYACRAGSTTLYSFGDDIGLVNNYAWSSANSSSTHPVGLKLPNNWGLYDIHGNVWEFCLDSWHDNYTGAPTDGSAWEPGIGLTCVSRGGGWSDNPNYCRSGFRDGPTNLTFIHHCLGFRVVAVP